MREREGQKLLDAAKVAMQEGDLDVVMLKRF